MSVDQRSRPIGDLAYARDHALVGRPRTLDRAGRELDLGVRIHTQDSLGITPDPVPSHHGAVLDLLAARPPVLS
jgi:hypothetical protein